MQQIFTRYRRWLALAALAAVLGGYWLLPIRGRVLIIFGPSRLLRARASR